MTGGVWLVLAIEPCDDYSWLHGVYGDQETAERGFANALTSIFGPHWETWLEIDEKPVPGPASGTPAKRGAEESFGVVELSGPYPILDEPVPVELDVPEWYDRACTRRRRTGAEETGR